MVPVSGKATWSWQQDGTKPYTTDSTQALPTDLAIPDTFLVRTEVEFDHKLLLVMPGVENLDIRNLHMKEDLSPSPARRRKDTLHGLLRILRRAKLPDTDFSPLLRG